MSASARAKKRELRKDNKTLIIMCVHVEVARPVCVCVRVCTSHFYFLNE